MTEKEKCVFLDRDGVLNEELGYQITDLKDFKPIKGLHNELQRLKKNGFLLIVITNQSGIAKGHYTDEFIFTCHRMLQKSCGHLLDDLYFAPGHESVSKSLLRKPESLMFEKAIAKHGIDIKQSWMIGDKERDIIPAAQLGLKSILISSEKAVSLATHQAAALKDAIDIILT